MLKLYVLVILGFLGSAQLQAEPVRLAFTGAPLLHSGQGVLRDGDIIPVAGGQTLSKAIYAAANEALVDFQKKCDRGSRPWPETVAFVGLQAHEPRISESVRRWLNGEIQASAGGGNVRPTEVSTLKLLAPFLSLGPKGQDEMKKAEDRIGGSPLLITVEVRRPAIDMLELSVSFIDKRPGCSDSTAKTFFLKLPSLELSGDSMPPGGDDDLYELRGFYHVALGEVARQLSAASRTYVGLQFDWEGSCDLRRTARPAFETSYNQLRQEVSAILDKPILPPLNDGDFTETKDAAIPEDGALIRLRFMPSSISKRLMISTIEFVHKGAKQYVRQANVVVDERALAGCEASAADSKKASVTDAGANPPGDQSPPDEGAPPSDPKPTSVEKDCAACPEMVVVPGGTLVMGSPEGEPGRGADEGPQGTKQIRTLAVARYETTVGEFETFLAESGYQPSALQGDRNLTCLAPGEKRGGISGKRNHRQPGFQQTPDHPVICVSWNDAKAYVSWLSTKTGKLYRLPSEAEFEYVARAGTQTAYWWGAGVDPKLANYELTPGRTSLGGAGTVAKGALSPNKWGFHHVSGNAAEWVEDCWNNRHALTPVSSEARLTGDCRKHVIRGGGWTYRPDAIRSASRDYAGGDESFVDVGFRVARELTR